jgi:hypothetical protein
MDDMPDTPLSLPQTVLALAQEAQRIEEDSLHSAKSHFQASSVWRWLHLFIGLPTTVLAGIAGHAAFESKFGKAGALSAVVAALSALSTFLNPSGRAATHHSAGTRYNGLKNQARIFHQIDVLHGEPKPLLERLKELAKIRDDLNEQSPAIPGWAFWLGRRGIERGEAAYRVDAGKADNSGLLGSRDA